MTEILASIEAEAKKIEQEVVGVFHKGEADAAKVETEVKADVHKAEADVKTAVTDVKTEAVKVETKVEYVAKEVYDSLAADVAKLKADFAALLARIEKHNSTGGAI